MRRFLSLFTMLMLCSVLAFAQSRVVSGKVTDNNGNAVPFATVKIKDTKTGLSADANGAYTIRVKEGDVLVISSSDFVTKSEEVGTKNFITTVLQRAANVTDIKEVVVTTALNVKRKADDLSYAAQGLKSDKLTTTRLTDVNTALAGKIAGVQVRTETEAKLGAASKIRLRGVTNFDDKSALVLLDGTAVDDITSINMDDVDDVQVLKGPSAIAVYGQRAEAGVLMLTTKKGKKRPGIGLEISSSAIFTSVAQLPRYQNEYAGGTTTPAGSEWQTFTWDPSLPVEWKALDGKVYHTYFDDASWGPRMNGQEYIPWYAWIPGHERSFKTASLTPQPNNIRDFWSKGVNLINNVNFSKAGDGYSIRLSYTNQDNKGIVPYSFQKKNNISTQVNFDLSSRISVGANINYLADKINGDFDDTYGNNSTGSFNSWFHRDLDINILRELKDLRTPTGALPSWNLDDQTGVSSKFYNGTLFWTNYFTYYQQVKDYKTRSRLFGDINLTYKFNNNFKVQFFLRQNRLNQIEEGIIPYLFERSTSDGSSPLAINENDPATKDPNRPIRATYQMKTYSADEFNYEGLASYNNKFFHDKLAFNINVGGNIRRNSTNQLDNGTKGGLVVEDLFTLSNSKITPYYTYSRRTNKSVRSVYATATLSWNEFFNLDLSARNDWSSALPVNKNSYFYPGAGASLVFSKFTKSAMPFLSYGRLRGSVAQVGEDLGAYLLDLSYPLGTTQWDGNSTSTTSNTLVDPNIKPSISTTYEFGGDLRFFKDRLGISATYYNDDRKDVIINAPVVSATGFSRKLLNAGRIAKNGIELTLEATPIKWKNLQWDFSVNYAQNKTKVDNIDGSATVLYLTGSDYTSSAGNPSRAPGVWAVVGGEYGQLRGTGIKRNDAGQPILTSTGQFQKANNLNFGSILPKYTGGVSTSFRVFQNFTISATADFVKGGKYYSLSQFWGKYSGLLQETATLNDKGNSVRDAVVDGGGVHVFGVDAANKPVDYYVEASTYFHQFGDGTYIDESCIFDLDYVKLREVSLGYKIPVNRLGGLFKNVQSANFSISVRNPAILYSKNRNVDPSEIVGSYGESGQLPATRSIGVNLKLGF